MKKLPTYPRVLGLSLSSRGFGYAVLEGLDTLADWGVKSISGDKNTGTIAKVKEQVDDYRPDVVAIEDTVGTHRSARTQSLTRRIVHAIRGRDVTVLLFRREHVRRTFLSEGRRTKHALAERVAEKFPEELGFRLPPKRRPWMSEDHRMAIFDAVAVGLIVRRQGRGYVPAGRRVR